MAEIALTCLLRKLSSLLPEEEQLLERMGADVVLIKKKVKQLRVFQRRADVIEENSLELEIFVKDVREVAYESEDAIDEFMFHLALHHNGNGSRVSALIRSFVDLIKNFAVAQGTTSPGLSRGVTTRSARQDISTPLKDILSKFEDIIRNNQNFSFDIAADNGSNPPSSRWNNHQEHTFLQDEEDLVGIQKPKQQLIELLVADESKLRVIPVIGMGGLGKTTLVSMVYNDAKVKMHFQSHAWITVSQTFRIEDILEDLLQQLYRENELLIPPEAVNLPIQELKDRIYHLLEKNRYLLIFDDLWSIDAWKSIKLVLPWNERGSRIMLTTRNVDVASTACDSLKHVYSLNQLSEEESWTLFCNKTFDNGSCPEHLIKVSKTILKKCAGLPLAITAITGVLITKDQDVGTDDWKIVDGSLGAELEDNRRLKSTYKILSLSYNDLPYNLKSCFLYLSMFPENHLIERVRLIRLWMAEGFLKEKQGKTLEDVGESYLTELLNRSLIQVAETASDGRMKTFRIHDLLRELIVMKSRDQGFVAISKNGAPWPANVRRLSLQNSLLSMRHSQNLLQLRSLITFEVEEPLNSSSMPALFYGGFKLLTVLELRGTTIKQFPSTIFKLLNLRYLSLKETKVRSVPNSIGMLQKLQTLDLKNTLVSKLPTEILKLQQLRNLLVYRYEFEIYSDFPSRYGFKAPRGIGSLNSLRKLCLVDGSHSNDVILTDLGRLKELRRLGVIELRRENGLLLCASIDNLTNLHALSISSSRDETLNLQYINCPPVRLRRLYLTGRLEHLPLWITALDNLVKIFLKSSMLPEDKNPLEIFEGLPNLVHVELRQAYTGSFLSFKAGTFKKLKILGLHEFKSLAQITVEETAMPILERLVIKSCPLLKTLPWGINHLSKLGVLDFISMPEELISTVQLTPSRGVDYDKVQHIPEVNSIVKRNGFWETRRLNVDDKENTSQVLSPWDESVGSTLKAFQKK